MPFWRSATEPDLQNVRTTGSLPVHEGKRHLPQPRGPHSVGFVDLMTPGEDGAFVRVLYPTAEQCLGEHARWPEWMQDEYITGMLEFIQAMTSRWPSWAPKTEYLGIDRIGFMSSLIPKLGFPNLFRLMNGRVYSPIIRDAKPDASKKWPLVVFSHGLGCSRGAYSRICYDVASYGFVVAAIEHRDGSACLSYHLDGPASTPSYIHHSRVSPDEDEYEFRNRQVHQRAREASRTLDVMVDISQGKEVGNLMGENGELIKEIGKVLDVQKPIITGHSFGGATTVLALSRDPRFTFGIALDAWLFPLKNEPFEQAEEKPLLFISTESFMSRENILKMSEFKETKNQCQRKFLYIKGSVHQNHIDLPFVFSYTLVRKVVGMHSETCPETVIDLNNKLMVQFLWSQLGMEPDDEVDKDVEKRRDLLADPFKPWAA